MGLVILRARWWSAVARRMAIARVSWWIPPGSPYTSGRTSGDTSSRTRSDTPGCTPTTVTPWPWTPFTATTPWSSSPFATTRRPPARSRPLRALLRQRRLALLRGAGPQPHPLDHHARQPPSAPGSWSSLAAFARISSPCPGASSIAPALRGPATALGAAVHPETRPLARPAAGANLIASQSGPALPPSRSIQALTSPGTSSGELAPPDQPVQSQWSNRHHCEGLSVLRECHGGGGSVDRG